MKLVYHSDYISVKRFNTAEIEDSTVLIGINGSGKTHLLNAIKNGDASIEGIDKSETVYYSYNDFTVMVPGNYHQNPASFQNRIEGIDIEKNNQKDILEKNIFKALEQNFPLELFWYHFSRQNIFSFEEVFGNKNDYDALKDLKNLPDYIATINSGNGSAIGAGQAKMQRILQIINKYRSNFTPPFLNFLISCSQTNTVNLNEIDFENIKEKFSVLPQTVDDAVKMYNEDYYNFIKSGSGNKRILSLTANDFENPYLFLEELKNEEKDYQLLKANNIYDKVRKESFGEDIKYLEMEDFIKTYGLSPVEQINEVLEKYDCNGYYLSTNKLGIRLGEDKEKFQVHISLKTKNGDYSTDFERLSSGEKTLIALALLIYKSKKKRIIPRVLLLDEIDSSLHPSMIKRLLGVIQEIFINEQKIKVILATHSPTTVALSPEESIFIVNKEGLEKISKVNKSEAIQLLSEGFATLSNEDTQQSIVYNVEKSELPVLFTEGITDKIILETAWKKLYNKPFPFYIQDCFDAGFLANLFRRGLDGQDGIFINYGEKALIALFDFDSKGYNLWNGLNENWSNIETNPRKCLTKENNLKNGYALLLPVSNNLVANQVVIQDNKTFKENSILTIELLFYGIEALNHFFNEEPSVGGNKIIQFRGDKRKFARKVSSFEAQHFTFFKPLFEKIIEVIKLHNEK